MCTLGTGGDELAIQIESILVVNNLQHRLTEAGYGDELPRCTWPQSDLRRSH